MSNDINFRGGLGGKNGERGKFFRGVGGQRFGLNDGIDNMNK
jgi:hypothetical protein